MNLILIETGLVSNFIKNSASLHFNGSSLQWHNPKRLDHYAICFNFRGFFNELLFRVLLFKAFSVALFFRVSANGPDLN